MVCGVVLASTFTLSPQILAIHNKSKNCYWECSICTFAENRLASPVCQMCEYEEGESLLCATESDYGSDTGVCACVFPCRPHRVLLQTHCFVIVYRRTRGFA